MRNLCSCLASIKPFILPSIGIILILVSDFSFVTLQIIRKENGNEFVSTIFIALYNLNVFLVLWSLWKTCFDDPGKIKKNSGYSETKLSKIALELYK